MAKMGRVTQLERWDSNTALPVGRNDIDSKVFVLVTKSMKSGPPVPLPMKDSD
jgi:hypothetical protein